MEEVACSQIIDALLLAKFYRTKVVIVPLLSPLGGQIDTGTQLVYRQAEADRRIAFSVALSKQDVS